jgi:hypothetical protein
MSADLLLIYISYGGVQKEGYNHATHGRKSGGAAP